MLLENLDAHNDATALMARLLGIVASTTVDRLYVIVDEYDDFANNLFSQGAQDLYDAAVTRTGFVRSFYATLKAGSESGAVVLFVTGVSPILLDDLSSGFNVLANIAEPAVQYHGRLHPRGRRAGRAGAAGQSSGHRCSARLHILHGGRAAPLHGHRSVSHRADEAPRTVLRRIPILRRLARARLQRRHGALLSARARRHGALSGRDAQSQRAHGPRPAAAPREDRSRGTLSRTLSDHPDGGPHEQVSLRAAVGISRRRVRRSVPVAALLHGHVDPRRGAGGLAPEALEIPDRVVRELYWDHLVTLLQEQESLPINTSALDGAVAAMAVDGDIQPFLSLFHEKILKTLGLKENTAALQREVHQADARRVHRARRSCTC